MGHNEEGHREHRGKTQRDAEKRESEDAASTEKTRRAQRKSIASSRVKLISADYFPQQTTVFTTHNHR